MPLSPAVPRRHIHTRRIECAGYIREDGLWDIEARMTDTKTYGFGSRHRQHIAAGEPIHEMVMRITVDDDLTLLKVEAETLNAPYRVCPGIAAAYQQLEGLRIQPGFTAAVRKRVGGVQGCTHLSELLGPLATTAVQTVRASAHYAKALVGRPLPEPENASSNVPGHLNSCHALDSAGPVVREIWPEAWTGAQD